MLVFLSVCILILNLVAAYVRVGVNFYLDFFGNDGFIKLYVFGIRIFKARIHFEHDENNSNNLVVEHGKKEGKIHLNNDPQDKKSVAAMLRNPAMSDILVEKISAHFTVGKTNDAFFTVGVLQTLRVLFYAFLAPVKCRYSMKITESFTPVYNRDVIHADFIGIIGISIADIIVSLVGNLIKKADFGNRKETAKI